MKQFKSLKDVKEYLEFMLSQTEKHLRHNQNTMSTFDRDMYFANYGQRVLLTSILDKLLEVNVND